VERQEFTPRATRPKMRLTTKTSTNFWRHTRELAPQRIRVEPSFDALWRSRATAIFLEPLKELWKEESQIKRAATADLATIRSSCPTDSKKPSVNCQPK